MKPERGESAASSARSVRSATPTAPRPPNRPPRAFRQAVASLLAPRPAPRSGSRPSAPQRLAPWSYALIDRRADADGDELATGRLVLLYDPDGAEAWDGQLRLVAFASAELEPDIANDPSLPEVCWSWLTGALAERQADHLAAGGTVTQTTSTRFGDVTAPKHDLAIELAVPGRPERPTTPHLLGFLDLLCTAAGLPPEGVSVLQTT